MCVTDVSLYKYYGGKAKLADHIVSLIPKHRIYCEPFFGSGAVFFRKHNSEISMINDKLEIVINFWRVVRDHFDELKELVNGSLHSRDVLDEAKNILKNNIRDNILRAWAFWFCANFSFGGKLTGGWGYDKTGMCRLNSKLELFNSFVYQKLQNVCIENKDALDLFAYWDGVDTFWYCDPPYIETHQGHYSGYSNTDYDKLLDTLSKIKGKFILSSYHNELLDNATDKYGWNHINIDVKCHVKPTAMREDRTEVLVRNFELADELSLFPE